jgi:hypothetical protein
MLLYARALVKGKEEGSVRKLFVFLKKRGKHACWAMFGILAACDLQDMVCLNGGNKPPGIWRA